MQTQQQYQGVARIALVSVTNYALVSSFQWAELSCTMAKVLLIIFYLIYFAVEGNTALASSANERNCEMIVS